MAHSRQSLVVAAVVALVLAGCAEERPAAGELGRDTAAPLEVYVVSYPLRYLAERIGGADVRVSFPAPPDVDPADWMPDAETVAAYQSADLILLNGAGYARWVALASLPKRHIVDVAAGMSERLIERKDTLTHAHGSTGTHSHEGFVATLWLDPSLATLQARNVATALGRARPDAEARFQKNLAALEIDLVALDARLAEAAKRIGDAPLLFSHPVYAYLIRRYELNARSLHWEPELPPNDAAWRELRVLLTEQPARWMLWEAEPSADTRKALRQLGVESAVYSPCGNAPLDGDFLSVMRDNADRLEEIATGALP